MTSKKPLVRQFSAGGAVYKKEGKSTKWLIIQPKKTDRWQLPKGMIDKGESSEQAAIRETREEGGVQVEVIGKVGKQTYFFHLKGNRVFKTVIFYLMKYLSDTTNGIDKKEISKAKFVDLEIAKDLLSFDNDFQILQKAQKKLKAK